ncbi:MAG: CBS domain-containing protein [Rhodopirellula sp.]|nr:CBS domain-containing protein [Rhodopirellula sp.]
MTDHYLEDEANVAAEQDLFDSHSLQHPIHELPELHPVVCLPSTAKVREAIHSMTEKRVGIILIVDDGVLTGVFSERDVLIKVAGSGIDIDETPVAELMTQNPQALRPHDELVYALNQMSVGGYRHVPIVDGNRHPVAVVSMRDIVEYIVSLYPDEVLKLPPSPDQSITQTREGA